MPSSPLPAKILLKRCKVKNTLGMVNIYSNGLAPEDIQAALHYAASLIKEEEFVLLLKASGDFFSYR